VRGGGFLATRRRVLGLQGAGAAVLVEARAIHGMGTNLKLLELDLVEVAHRGAPLLLDQLGHLLFDLAARALEGFG
ncbi:hypothetical protein PMAYCL1PPCAC_24575, partial [Pristionchus mayeri]